MVWRLLFDPVMRNQDLHHAAGRRWRNALLVTMTSLAIAVAVGCAGTWRYTPEQAPCARQCMVIQNQCTAGAALNQDAFVRLGAVIGCSSQQDACYTSCGMVRE